MLNETLIERALSWWVQERGEAALSAARRAFEQATGAIAEASADYEPRIAHFLEQHVCEGRDNPIVGFIAILCIAIGAGASGAIRYLNPSGNPLNLGIAPQ